MATIKNELLKGFFWTAIEKYSGIFVTLIVTMVLARLLSPSDYGVMAIATIFINFFSLLTSLGIGPAIIQKKELDQKDLDSIFTFTIYIGGVLAIAFFCSSWLISELYGDSRLVFVCQILSVNVFFSAVNMVPRSLMSRDKRFKEIAIRTLLLQVISGVIAIIAAYKGVGLYTLLIPPICSSIGIFLYNRRFYPCAFVIKMQKRSIDKIASYSAYQFLFEFITYFSSNIDKMIIGKFVSISQLGFYEKSYRLVQLPLNNVTAVINPVLQPVLKDLQNDYHQLAVKYGKIIKLICTLSFPIGVYMCFTGKELIYIMYGSQWDLAVPCFQILSVCIPFKLMISSAGSIYQAGNAPKKLFYLGIINSSFTIISFLIASYFWRTIEAIAIAFTINCFVCTIITFMDLYVLVLKSSLKLIGYNMIYPLINALCLIIIFLILKKFCVVDNIYGIFIINTFVTLFVSLIVVQLSGQYNLIGFISRIKHK